MSLKIGNLGLQGPPSSSGSTGVIVTPDPEGHGFTRYYDSQYTAASPQNIPGNQNTILANDGILMNGDRTYLRSMPDHDFIRDNKFYPIKTGDTYILRLSMTGRSSLTNTAMRISLMIPGLVQQDGFNFPISAGQITRFTVNYNIFVLENFRINGGQFVINSDDNVQIWGTGLLIIPVTLA
jgi:hypothetical protein